MLDKNACSVVYCLQNERSFWRRDTIRMLEKGKWHKMTDTAFALEYRPMAGEEGVHQHLGTPKVLASGRPSRAARQTRILRKQRACAAVLILFGLLGWGLEGDLTALIFLSVFYVPLLGKKQLMDFG